MYSDVRHKSMDLYQLHAANRHQKYSRKLLAKSRPVGGLNVE